MSAGNEKIVVPDEDTFKLSTSINNLSLTVDVLSTCDNCGKEGSNINNICNKCKSATYCNAACKKKHRSKHKEACERRVAELHEEQLERERCAAELHDKKLFKQPPPSKDDCPICMLPLPSLQSGARYRACCGKMICSGCIHAVEKRDGGVGLCPFCRSPMPTAEESVEQIKKRAESVDAKAIYNLGCYYSRGSHGFPQDRTKALELWHRAAAELGNTQSYYSIGGAYDVGNGVERDEKKANHYLELAAMRGHVLARYNLGISEYNAGNFGRAVKHYMIAAGCGDNDSVEVIKQMFMNGDATKDDYAKALQVYQAYLGEIKSPQRDEAAVAHELYKYY
jgi:hypothetical protein